MIHFVGVVTSSEAPSEARWRTDVSAFRNLDSMSQQKVETLSFNVSMEKLSIVRHLCVIFSNRLRQYFTMFSQYPREIPTGRTVGEKREFGNRKSVEIAFSRCFSFGKILKETLNS